MDLITLHKKFSHVYPQKPFNLLKKANENVGNSDLSILKEISQECYPCQKFTRDPLRYVASAPEDIQFNHEVALDIMYIRKRPILHVLCAGTRFNVAAFVEDRSSETIWKTFNKIWINPYSGAPHLLRAHQGSEFTSDEFKHNCESLGIFLIEDPIESPNALRVVERHHAPLGQIYLKLEEENPDISPDLLLQQSFKPMNDCLGPEEYVPSLLVYGMLPRIPVGSTKGTTPNQVKRIQAMHAAWAEMQAIVAKTRLQEAFSHNMPMSLLDYHDLNPGMQVLV